ncbi:MAG: T9SS type A sorting domain-containing protein, partial [Candidatus Eisenbacteria sp.]|nr:T9SS type A sorting domain-containing protein [Candidatus Eisenbacteria bacterium]
SYIDAWNDYLRYAHWDGSGWQFATPDSPGFYGDEGIMTSLALDSSDHPHIAYTHWETDDLRYAFYDGSVWDITTVDNQGITGKYPSISLDSSDYAHISYAGAGGGCGLLYSRWTGSEWERTEVDMGGGAGLWTSIDLDQLDYPHISYAAGGSAILKCAWLFNPMSVDRDSNGGRGSLTQSDLSLPRAVPSPSDGAATISFTLPYSCDVHVELFAADGRKVATLAHGEYQAGTHQSKVSNLSSGVYMYRLEAGSFIAARKMVVVQ